MSKRILTGILAVSCLLFILLSGGTDIKDLEKQLDGTTGAERLDILVRLTEEYLSMEPKKALEYGKEASELILQFPAPSKQVALSTMLMAAHRALGNYPEAEKNGLKALALAEQKGDAVETAYPLMELGFTYYLLNDYNKALEYLSRAEKTYLEKTEMRRELAKVHNWLGLTYWRLGNYSRALEYILGAEKTLKQYGDKPTLAGLYNSLGFVYWQLEKTDKALEYFHQSLALYRELQSKSRIAILMNNIAFIHNIREEYDKALEYYKQSLELNKEFGILLGYVNTLQDMGLLFEKQQDIPKAMDYLTRALEARKNLDDKRGKARTMTALARVKRKSNQFKPARELLTQALTICETHSFKERLRDANLEMSELFEAQKNQKEALVYYTKYKELSDEIFNENSRKKIAQLQTTYEMEKKEKELDLLNKEKEIRELDLERQRNVKNSFFIVSMLILLLAFVIFQRYRFKSRLTGELEKEIDDHRVTGQKLRESEEKFRVLAEKSVVGICIIQHNAIRYANPRYVSIFGYDSQDIIGKSPVDLAIDEDRNMVVDYLTRRLTGTGEALNFEFKGQAKDGEVLHLESYGTLTHYEGEPAVLETIIDITERKRAEMELLKTQKLESVGILAGGIAHDFNNLLSVITDNITYAIEDTQEDQKTSNMLQSAGKASRQARELAKKLITFSEGGWIIPQRMKLPSLLKSTLQHFPEMEQVLTGTEIGPDLPPVYVDERQMRQVLFNLLQNAREAASDTEKIDVRLKASALALEAENNLSLEPGDYVHIVVSDNGKGIPRDQLDKIFDPYFSTKDTVTQKGMGLGLAICYSIIRKHNGHIAVSSQVGKGTDVDLYLPVYKPE